MAARRRIRRAVSRFGRALIWQSGRTVHPPVRRARILIYHSISDDPHNPFAVSPGAFREQMEHLAAGFSVVGLADLAAMIEGGRELPERYVAVTFDDGYEDNYLHAFPVLQRFAIPATIFLVAGSIRDEGAIRDGGSVRPGEISFLRWDQVREMARGGVTFGSHTMTHPSLAALGRDEVARELRESRAMLEERLGSRVAGLAYPYGTHRDVDGGIVAAARAAGYTHACMAVNGTAGSGTDVFALPRTKIEYGDDMDLFRAALEGSLDAFMLLDRARAMLGKRRDPGVGIQSGNR